MSEFCTTILLVPPLGTVGNVTGPAPNIGAGGRTAGRWRLRGRHLPVPQVVLNKR
jgi:hypothetical protein